jgi:hypothetical protein
MTLCCRPSVAHKRICQQSTIFDESHTGKKGFASISNTPGSIFDESHSIGSNSQFVLTEKHNI